MSRTTIYCPDIECESCVNVLTKVLDIQGITHFAIRPGAIDIAYDHAHITPDGIIKLIQARNYRASTLPFARKGFLERFKEFLTCKEKYEVEHRLVKYSLSTFFLLCLFQFIAYFGFFKSIPNFLQEHSWWLFYTTMAVVSICSGIWHRKSYRAEVTCMVGMMIGMTFGMQTGMMLGTILGATNGLFVGGLVGMFLGVGVGVYSGKCCGIMGVLEGMMAGIMGGLMGSMIGAMFNFDHLLWLMPPFMILNLVVMWGISYMLFEEVVENNSQTKKNNISFSTFFCCNLIIVTLITIFIIYGPKTGVAALT